MKTIVLPCEGIRDLRFYLAMEEYMARHYEDEVFFVWQSEPTVIIGRNQDMEAEVNMNFCRKNDIRIVRRKSGGGCVYSDEGNIMISYISRRGEVSEIFDRYLSMLTSCLKAMGIKAVRSERNDILVNGMKVSGNAMQVLADRTIAHGTLLFAADFTTLQEAITPPAEKLLRHGISSVRQRVANLTDFLPEGWDIERVKNHIIEYFTDGAIILSDTDIKTIHTHITQNYGE